MATVEQTMMKVQRILTGPMGLKVMLGGDRFTVSFNDTSTHLTIRVQEWGTNDDGEPRTVVLVNAPILWGVSPTPEVFEWVARKGGSRWLGHVEVHDADDGKVNLIFSHTLLGDTLDQPELETAIWGLLTVADTWDDELKAKFGGSRSSD
jgi:hypothetical protein